MWEVLPNSFLPHPKPQIQKANREALRKANTCQYQLPLRLMRRQLWAPRITALHRQHLCTPVGPMWIQVTARVMGVELSLARVDRFPRSAGMIRMSDVFSSESDPVKIYIQAHPGWYWASYAVFFVTYMTLACCPGPRRHFPWNLILLSIFTLTMSYMTGMMSSFYNTKSVLLCFGITALVCFAVTIFSFQTKFDFTSCHGVLFVLLIVLCISGLVLVIVLPFHYVPWLHAVYAVLGAVIFTMFLAFDTQLLIGNRRYAISPEEYIFGALNIYLDIIYIFTFMLQIFGTNRE
ncbi:protein lifeguard 2-like isoform X3 [Scyliorhinus torazame]|uniref:protein lifeguard 2-like isoform X3 n=1 Tax=Scyliorhinus torazame TaxID=75743 RepID=UPI003B5C7CD4